MDFTLFVLSFIFILQQVESLATTGAGNGFTTTMMTRRGAITAASLTIALPSLAVADDSSRVSSCQKPANGGPANCVSTASVKQVDLYVAPWTWNEGVSSDEVVARLKGCIEADSSLSLVEQEDNNNILKVRAERKFATDELLFRVDPNDRVITFRSQQVDGPESVSDFGANRNRLEDIRKRVQVLDVMGADMESADSGRREGVSAQLRAFWGLQSGGGYESVLLDEEED